MKNRNKFLDFFSLKNLDWDRLGEKVGLLEQSFDEFETKRILNNKLAFFLISSCSGVLNKIH
jgi:hypothetical protein